jgi:hypothetical protein
MGGDLMFWLVLLVVTSQAEDSNGKAPPDGGPPPPTAAASPTPDKPVLNALFGLANAGLEQAAKNLDEVKNEPFDVFVMVLNPREAAVAKKGEAMVMVGELVAFMGVGDSIPSHVYDEIVPRAEAAFLEDGVDVVVSHGHYDVRAQTARRFYNGTSWTHMYVPAGNYELVKITVFNPVGVAEAKEGFGKVTVALAAGVDVERKVQDQVHIDVWTTLRGEGIDALILE